MEVLLSTSNSFRIVGSCSRSDSLTFPEWMCDYFTLFPFQKGTKYESLRKYLMLKRGNTWQMQRPVLYLFLNPLALSFLHLHSLIIRSVALMWERCPTDGRTLRVLLVSHIHVILWILNFRADIHHSIYPRLTKISIRSWLTKISIRSWLNSAALPHLRWVDFDAWQPEYTRILFFNTQILWLKKPTGKHDMEGSSLAFETPIHKCLLLSSAYKNRTTCQYCTIILPLFSS